MAEFELIRADRMSDGLSQLLELHRLCFSHYVGVLPSERSFLEWYLCRPGSGPENIFVAREGESAVSAVFLTLTRFRLGEAFYPVGIIDTVMTHPGYRKRGLASRLMDQAETAMREAGCRFGYLYTIPDTPPFTLYRHLGYQDHKRVFHLLKQSNPPAPPAGPVCSGSLADHQLFLNRMLDPVNGFIRLDEPQWAWRKVSRPSSLPAALYAAGEKEIRASITVSSGQVTTGQGDWKTAAFLSDWAGHTPEDLHQVICQALASIEPGVTIDILCPVDNQAEWDILREQGFDPVTAESAMLHPLDENAEAIMEKNRPGKWYPLIESVVGI